MALFNYQTPVKYVCTCGELKPITRIYFCRHCSSIRCGFCVSHEVDARYCPICMENLPAAEAWMKNNCCSSCMNCPVCQFNLTTRVTTVKNRDPVESAEKEEGKSEKSETKKFYYLCCFSCHWTSRDVGIPDQTSSSASWPEFENPQTARINQLMEFYMALSLQEKVINERKQLSMRRTYSHLTGMSAAMVRRRTGLPSYLSGQYSFSNLPDSKKPNIEPSVPKSEVNDLPDSIFTTNPDLIKVATLEQRFGTPGLQGSRASELKPCKKLLLTKRSQRCRECEHNVTKPDFNPSSIKFKIQLSAYYHVPNISIKKCEPLYAGKESDLFLHIINPTPHQITITLLPFNTEIKRQPPYENPPSAGGGNGGGDIESQDNSKQNKNRRVLLKIDYLMKIEPKPPNVNITAAPILPETSIILPGRDDAAEFDDGNENQNFNDDKKIVVWRKGNQVVIKFSITPNENLESGEDVVIGFVLDHTYINTIIQDKSKQKINHQVQMIINAGKLI